MRICSQIDPFSGRYKAIQNLGGRSDLYLKYVKRFQANYGDSFSQLTQYLNASMHEEACRLMHSIKGLAATLGMENLRQQSEALEIELKKDSHENLPLLINAFQVALMQAINAPIPSCE
ncbi:MAG: Hpt domain-containing protein [Anaerovoracaceae bacterium]|jgi:two-component system sensor histidine kinase/response regulator